MSSSNEDYHVFLSFRGEDTRTTFIGHLYDALRQKPIKIFIDYQLKRGEDVWPALSKAIEDSHVSIVVFSENYATSKWCLEELVKILQCRKDHDQVVIPVFYQIDPTHIRKQTGSYEKAFAKHERELKNDEAAQYKVSKWKAALTEAANISGWDSRNYEADSQIIKNIVHDVLQKVYLKYPNELKGVVGTEANCKNVELLMTKFRVIGIWGMGGIGKTIIAKVLFAKLFPQYDKACFVANVKDYTLDKLLRELLQGEISTSNVVGSTFDMKGLSGKKVFIVLDNVDINSSDLLNYLCRAYGDLSPDSRLIITTRHKDLLAERVDWIFPVKKWKTLKSLELFCLEVFDESNPPKRYEDLSKQAVNYAGGVPLALKVLGSHLRSRITTEFWESTLRKLNNYPNERIQTVLKESYDGLDDLQKKIFLDIAFFFKGENKDHVISILDACGFEASSGIDVLEDKALITISNSNIIQMHDLIQIMGLDIVRKQCIEDPEKRSRLRGIEQVHDILRDNKGTSAVEGIILDLSQIEDIHLSVDTFKKMKNLRFLKFYISLGQSSGNMYLPKVLEPFSDKLRYFEWNGYTLASLPPPFCAKLLVEIRMPHSLVKQLWQGTQELDNLERLDLRECKQFKELPDLSKAPRLKGVNLSGCESLAYLHPSVLSSDTLVTLILDRCTKLESVKAKKHLKSLEKIGVNGCSSLKEFAVSSDLIENLDLSNTGIKDISMGLQRNLRRLNLEGLRLKHLPEELSCLTCLEELKLSSSGLVVDKQQLHALFNGLQSLKILHLKDCSILFELPDNIRVLQQLQELRLDGSNVKSFPGSIKHLEELEILSLVNCRELLCLPELPPLIKQLHALNCMSLESVSNLKTFATKMMGKTKHISFQNSLKLNGSSLYFIMESLHLTMVSAAFHNVAVRRLGVNIHSYNYNSVEVCLPGSRVPRQFTHRTTKSSITIELPTNSNLLGFIYSVVLSPSSGVKKYDAEIQCQCLLAEGTKATSWQKKGTTELKSDHVYVWYDPFHCDNILGSYEPKVCFEFRVTTDAGEIDGSIGIKECGVHLINVSESHRVLPELDLDSGKKKGLEKGLQLESGRSIERSDEKESNDRRNQIQNQQQDLSEHCSSDCIVVTESKSVVTLPDAEVIERKEHFPDVEEIIESARKQINADAGRGHKENTRESTKAVKSKGNEGMPTESDAGLHLPVDSVNKENVFKDKSSVNDSNLPDNIEEAKHLEENQNVKGEKIIVHSDIHHLTAEEPNQEIENESSGLDIPKGQDESDEDPFAELESILFGSQKSSPKAASSTSDVAIREALHNLECLLEKSLENIFDDMQLQQQLQISLESIEQASEDNVSPSVVKLVKRMTSSTDEMFTNFSLTQKVVKDHTNHLQQKAKLVRQTGDGQKQQRLLREKMRQYKFEAESLEKDAGELDEKIRLLVEQKETVKMKQTQLKEALEKCDGEKKKLKDEAKNWVTESKGLMSVIKSSESSYAAAISKQEKLNDKWESFRTAFSGNSKTLS